MPFLCYFLIRYFLFIGTYRCSAKNDYLKSTKQIRHSLEVINSITVNNAKLLPPLQKSEFFVPNGSALRLHCAPTSTATSKGNAIRWTYTARSPSSTPIELPTQNPNQLYIVHTNIDEHDGIYECYFGDEHQVRVSFTKNARKTCKNPFRCSLKLINKFLKSYIQISII